jgi:outer membrane protein insertion porin family/translocation and assembly module TamA
VVQALALWLAVACAPAPTRPIVSAIDLRENEGSSAVDDDAILDGLATYDEYDPNVLSRDLERVERYYRARGYYEAKVTASRVLTVDARHVRIEIRVSPGKPVMVNTVTLPGLANLPFSVVSEVTSARHLLESGAQFDEARFDDMKAAILEALQDHGFPFAKVDAKAKVDLRRHTADLEIALDSGPEATYGDVQIIGLQQIPEDKVRDILHIRPGRPYSRQRLSDAQHAVLNLGVFTNVEIHEDLTHPESKRVPIQLVVHESALRTVRLGGGAELDVLRLNAHLRLGWEHLNFLGGTRDLAITELPGVDLYPTRLDGQKPRAPSRVLLENSLQLKFRQPSFIESRTTGTVDARYDVKPLLLPLNGNDPSQERVLGFHTVATTLGLERNFTVRLARKVRGRFTLAPSYNWQANVPFIYQRPPQLGATDQANGLPAGLVDVRVAFPALVTTLDFRDDPISTHRGIYLTNSLQVADKVFGGSVSDVRVQPEIRGYVPITKKTVTLATRLTMGFLIPRDYGDTLNLSSAQGRASTLDPTSADVVRDQEKLLLRAFYSGGSNSNRGYPLRGIGPHGPVGFLIPPGVQCAQITSQNRATCLRPLGGFTLWEASLELRFPFAGPVSLVTFADASDVTRDVGLGHVRFNVPHLSVGPGLRYLTPVGPLRLDVGYRVPGAQYIGHDALRADEGAGDVGNLFGISWLPMAINIAIGESF